MDDLTEGCPAVRNVERFCLPGVAEIIDSLRDSPYSSAEAKADGMVAQVWILPFPIGAPEMGCGFLAPRPASDDSPFAAHRTFRIFQGTAPVIVHRIAV
jgi:hypothetical protein